MGQPAYMVLKNNSISDRDIILKLSEASQAGVRVDMIVRGICCIRAGVPGETENVHIRSIVGRYLEHSRIYAFSDGGSPRVYIASGDFLTRNTECRVEVGVRIRDEKLVAKLAEILRLQLADNVNAREMQPDGSYAKVKPAPGEVAVDSQMAMYTLLQDDWDIPVGNGNWTRSSESRVRAGTEAAASPNRKEEMPAKPSQTASLTPQDYTEGIARELRTESMNSPAVSVRRNAAHARRAASARHSKTFLETLRDLIKK